MLTEHQQREFAEKAQALKLQKQKQQATSSKIHETSRCCSFQDNLGANEYRKDRRLHGFQLPLHPLQVAGWVAIVIFVTAAFALLIPVLPRELQPAFYCVLTGLFVVHVISHVVAVLTDPADRELRRISTRQVVPEFDRAKHAHVIENGRCHLCNIKTTSNRTKHCSVCNKCVGRFDHHCKWLNHCIGGRNYVAFLMCVLSAVIAVLVILAACIAEITLYYFKPDWLNIWNEVNDTLLDETEGTTIINEVIEQTNATLIGNLTNVLIGNGINGTENNETLAESLDDDSKNLGLSINGTIFVIFAATVGLLAAISAGLLLHLCFFHVYISYLGLTTYEYIRNQRTSATNVYPPQYTQKNGTHQKKENGLQTTINGGNHQNGTKNRRYTTFFRSKSAEAYFCSNVNPLPSNENVVQVDIESQNRPKTLYCCDTVESHHHRHKAYYMCSVMEDSNPENSMNDLSRINYYPEDASYESKTFHCCSEFVENEPAVATVTGILEQSRRETAFLHYTEQCTFCSFRIKRPVTRQQQQRVSASMEDKRCCIKTVATKHHRWRRKWNCCSNVPDSPDVPMASQFLTQNLPNSVVNVRQMNENSIPEAADQQNNNLEQATTTSTTITISNYDENSANNNNFSVMNGNNDASPNNNSVPVSQTENLQEIITISSSLSNVSSSSTTTIMPPSSSSSNNPTPSKRMRVRGIRPVIRLRHMFRVLGKRYRRPRCRHIPSATQVKQNQIRPLPQNNNGNSLIITSPVQQQASPNGQYSTVTHQTILPTSAIRNESQQQHLLVLPALPPPQRRRIKTTETDIQELADTLTLVQEQQTPSTIIRLSTSKSRRKQILRPRSPTLSPIHESGLSNPTSPLPKHRQSSVETPSDDILHITSEDCIN